MTRIERTFLQNQLVSRQRCWRAGRWYHRECAVLDVRDLVLQFRALEIVGHMAVLARLVAAGEGAVQPLEVGRLLELRLNLMALVVVDGEHDRVARSAQFCLSDLSSKYRVYSHRVYHWHPNYIVANFHVGIAGGIGAIDFVSWPNQKLAGEGGRIVQVGVAYMMANRARDTVARQGGIFRVGIIQLIPREQRKRS